MIASFSFKYLRAALFTAIAGVLLVSPAHAAVVPVIDGMVLHLDAGVIDASGASGELIGGLVQQWNDLSPRANHLSQTNYDGLERRPLYVADGGAGFNHLPVVRFDGVDDFLDASSTSWSYLGRAFAGLNDQPGGTVFAVLNNTDSTVTQRAVVGAPSSGTATHFPNVAKTNANNWVAGTSSSVWRYGAGTSIANGQAYLYSSLYDGTQAAADRLALRIDGDAYSLTGGSGAPAATTGSALRMLVGIDPSGGNLWKGDFAEVLIYNRALTPLEEDTVGQYLAAKYGLSTSFGRQLISLDFDVGAVGTKSGDEPGGFIGQSGLWNSMAVGSTSVTGPLLTADGSRSVYPVTFEFIDGLDSYLKYGSAGDALRGDVVFLQTGTSQVGPLRWEIAGLIPGTPYDLKFFGQIAGGNPANDAVFEIDGYGRVGPTADVATFLSVLADSEGRITGAMLHETGQHSAWSGLQIRGMVIPEPSTGLLTIVALVAGLLVRGRGRRGR